MEPGDIVLNRLKAHLGVFALSRCYGVVSPDYTVLRTLEGVDPEFLVMLLKSPALRPELRRRTKGIVEGLWRLYTPDLLAIEVAIPPLEEQRAIVLSARYSTEAVDRRVENIRRELDLLHQYRDRLVGDMVVGGSDGWK